MEIAYFCIPKFIENMKNKLLLIILLTLFVSNAQAQSYSKLFKKVDPSVVLIKVESKELVTDRATLSKQMITTSGLGSGVVINADGSIMTANHVIADAENIIIEFANGEEVPANVVTSSKDADVALIKLVWIPKNMQVATLGDSDATDIGERVMIIGAPYGLSHSLSTGVISGRHIEKNTQNNLVASEFFQTDAAINHGNSGGPVFNMKGDVIGIVSSILSESGGFEGIGFAATSNVAKEHLLGKQPFWFGVEFEVVHGELAKIFNLPQESGLAIQKVVSASPAALAGLKAGIYETNIEGSEFLTGGDFVLSVANFTISPSLNMEDVRMHFANMKSGTTFKIKVFRDGKIVDLVAVAP